MARGSSSRYEIEKAIGEKPANQQNKKEKLNDVEYPCIITIISIKEETNSVLMYLFYHS